MLRGIDLHIGDLMVAVLAIRERISSISVARGVNCLDGNDVNVVAIIAKSRRINVVFSIGNVESVIGSYFSEGYLCS